MSNGIENGTRRQPKEPRRFKGVLATAAGLALAAANTGSVMAQTDLGDSGVEYTEVVPLQSYDLPANTVIRGDVKVDGQRLFDNNSTTGLVVELTQPATVESPYGWSYFSASDRAQADEQLEESYKHVDETGCGNPTDGCATVDKIVWPDGSQQSNGAEGNFVPAETPEGWQRKGILLMDGTEIGVDQIKLGAMGEKSLPENAVISGDVKMDGERLYDDDSVIGLIVLNQKDGGVVLAPFGATVLANYDPEKQGELLKTLKAQMEETGCDLPDGCDSAEVKVYAQDGSVRDYDFEASEPVAEPTQRPDLTDPDKIADYVKANPDIDGSEALIMLDMLIKNGYDLNAPENQQVLNTLAECICQDLGVCEPTEKPTPTPRPEQPCPDFKDIEKPYGGWKPENAPVVTKRVANAIFQADGLVDGVRRYDNDGSTALITVIHTDNPKRHTFRYDFGGDLQPFCPTPEGDGQLDQVLAKDIKDTLARPEITSVKVVTITDDGVRTRVVKER